MKLMFLDESGDHNLKQVDPHYPIFALGGVIVDRAYLRDVVEPALKEFKQKHFGRDGIVLHTVEMAKGRGNYAFLADPSLRAEFYRDLNAMLRQLDYSVVACVIEKIEYVRIHGPNPADPYHHSLASLVDRFCQELGETTDAGFIFAEKRNPGLDRDIAAAWESLRTNVIGTGITNSTEIDKRIVDLSLKDKTPALAGLELADLVVTPIGRHFVGKPATSNEILWDVVERKLRRVNNEYLGHGLVIQPQR